MVEIYFINNNEKNNYIKDSIKHQFKLNKLLYGSEAGIRTPIDGTKTRSPTLRRPPNGRYILSYISFFCQELLLDVNYFNLECQSRVWRNYP